MLGVAIRTEDASAEHVSRRAGIVIADDVVAEELLAIIQVVIDTRGNVPCVIHVGRI